MASLINKMQGDSLSIGISFNAEYDVTRLQHFYVYLDDVLFTSTLVLDTIRTELKSENTRNFIGNKKLTVVLDDVNFGVRKKDLGYIYFAQSPTIYDSSVNTGYDLVVSLDISETATTANVEVLEAFRGYSAYDIYVKYTTDVPVKTEEEWNAAVNLAMTTAEDAATAALISEGLAEDYKDLALGYRNEAEGFKNTSTTKATEASNSAAAALLSEQRAKTSEDNSKASELAARISETNSHNSEVAAGISETNSHNSEVAAGISETNAHNSEVAAGISETNSHNSEIAAQGYATTATTQAGIATTKAGEAANSAISAANSAAAYYVYNITLAVPLTAGNYYTLASAIAATPSGVKKLGLVMTFADTATTWLSYQFIGSATSGWTTASNWQRVITERTLIPDEYVIADAINVLYGKITALEDLIKNATFDTIWVDTLTTVKALNYNGASLILTGTTAPSVTPDFIGQVYIKTSSTVAAYVATGTTNSGDWKQTA